MHPGLVTAALGQEVPFLKGHGTGNDFVILPDINSVLDLSESQVARLCDRRFGIGGDGILHVVPSDSTQADWFMDYRNADGSIAQMCGNGARVFARYLIDAGLESAGEFQIETRAGFHQVSASGDTIAVSMGTASPGPAGGTPEVQVNGTWLQADPWWMPNPHAVVFVDDLAAFGPELSKPVIEDAGRYPDGVNVEYVVDRTDGSGQLHAQVRVHERGVGETASCGTGACAVSLSMRRRHAVTDVSSTIVDVPGGRLQVIHSADGHIELAGPAVLVGRGTLDQAWWEGVA